MKLDRKAVISFGLTGFFLLFLVWGTLIYDNQIAHRAGRSYLGFVYFMLGFLPMMFLLIGVFEVWVPRDLVERHVGDTAGITAIVWVVLLAMLQGGPLYGAFPVAAALSKKGCAARYVFIYLGAFGVMKLPMLSFEVTFLGWRFSLVRLMLTLPVFMGIGFLMGRSHKCLVDEPSEVVRTR